MDEFTVRLERSVFHGPGWEAFLYLGSEPEVGKAIASAFISDTESIGMFHTHEVPPLVDDARRHAEAYNAALALLREAGVEARDAHFTALEAVRIAASR